MGKFLLGFIIAWALCHRYTHLMIAFECERLGGFFVDSKTYKCNLVIEHQKDNSIPVAILEAENGGKNG